jgi:hypothetical protein
MFKDGQFDHSAVLLCVEWYLAGVVALTATQRQAV